MGRRAIALQRGERACILENLGDGGADGRVEIDDAGCLDPVTPFSDPFLALADLDANGLNDLVVLSHVLGILVYQNAGGLSFSQAANLFAGGWGKAIAVADLDSDGAPDLVTANEDHLVVHWAEP